MQLPSCAQRCARLTTRRCDTSRCGFNARVGTAHAPELGIWRLSGARAPLPTLRRLVHDSAAQRTDAGNLDFQHVAGLHPYRRIAAVPDALGRPGRDDVAGREFREIRAEGDDLRHRIDQEIGAGLLHLLPIEPRHEYQTFRVRDVIRGDNPRTERTRAGKILAGGHREFLVIAHAAVDKAGVSRNVIKRTLDWDVAPGASDHDRQLALEIEAFRYQWPDQLTVVASECVGEPDEHAGLLWQIAAGLGCMRSVVDAGTEDLF